jgi:hypothetical protein
MISRVRENSEVVMKFTQIYLLLDPGDPGFTPAISTTSHDGDDWDDKPWSDSQKQLFWDRK